MLRGVPVVVRPIGDPSASGTPTGQRRIYVGGYTPAPAPPPALGADTSGWGVTTWESGPMATPKNSDRRDLNSSVQLGTPVFRGSAAVAPRPVVTRGIGTVAAVMAPSQYAAPSDPLQEGRCFSRG